MTRLIDADAFKKILSEHEMKHDKRRSFDDYACGASNAYEHASDLLDEMPTVERPHGRWVAKPKRVQVDETDEERIFETKLEWFCSSCDKSFGCRKPDDAFCKYCGSDNRPRENNSSYMIINGKYSENVEYGTRIEIDD